MAPGGYVPRDSARWRVREALRSWRRTVANAAQEGSADPPDEPNAAKEGRGGGADSAGICVGLSGGADSLALTAAAVAEYGSAGEVLALVVDHGLQPGSDEVARRAAGLARSLGADARVLTARVGTAGGPESAARDARFAALDDARGDRPVLLGHTLDDQAETVLLGLARGSGARSLRGMQPWSAPWGRPLLGIRRDDTRAACAEAGIEPWDDPHNADPRFLRVRVRRELLPLAEEILGPGVAEALSRTAALAADDDSALTALAAEALRAALVDEEPAALSAEGIRGLPRAVRHRVVKAWLARVGVPAPSAVHVASVAALATDWSGQGPVAVPAGPGEGEPRRQHAGEGNGTTAAGARRLTVAREGALLRLRVRQ